MRRGHEKAAKKCVLMIPKAANARCIPALYVLGDAFCGEIQATSVAGVRSRSYVEAARNAVLVRDTCNKRCACAVFSWLLAAKQLRSLPTDVARLVGKWVWASRGEECWHVDLPPLLRLDDEKEEEEEEEMPQSPKAEPKNDPIDKM